MQTPGARIVSIIVATLVILASTAPLAADPIQVGDPVLVIVTSGAPFTFSSQLGVSVPPLGAIHLAGTNGFTFDGGVQLGATGPGCCLTPGTTTSFFGRWLGNDVVGTVTLLGQTFSPIGNDFNFVSIDFQSSMFTLPSTGGTSFMVTAPFTLNGHFSHRSPVNGSIDVAASFIGSGIGTMPLTWDPSFNEWFPGIVQVQVSTPVLTPMPEPISIVLFGTALAGAYASTRFRRRTRATHKSG